jgi:hypothetical protein
MLRDGKLDTESEIKEGREHYVVVSVFEIPHHSMESGSTRGSGQGTECDAGKVHPILSSLDYKGWTEQLAGAGV